MYVGSSHSKVLAHLQHQVDVSTGVANHLDHSQVVVSDRVLQHVVRMRSPRLTKKNIGSSAKLVHIHVLHTVNALGFTDLRKLTSQIVGPLEIAYSRVL